MKPPSSNMVMLAVFTKSLFIASVLTQRKDCTGSALILATNSNKRQLEELSSSRCYKFHCDRLHQIYLEWNLNQTTTRRMYKRIFGFAIKIQIGQGLRHARDESKYFVLWFHVRHDVREFYIPVKCRMSIKSIFILLDLLVDRQPVFLFRTARNDCGVSHQSQSLIIRCAVSANTLGPYFLEDYHKNLIL